MSKLDDTRKRIARRKQNQMKTSEDIRNKPKSLVQDTINNVEYSIFDGGEKEVVSAGKGFFFLKVLLSILLVAGTAIVFQRNTATTQKIQAFISEKMDKEFQFAKVSKWYESNFGMPLTFFNNEKINGENDESNYALPASGKVLENFKTNGQGILVETALDAEVKTIDEGIVVFVGEKEGLGTAVIIQHADGSESWYGELKDVSVQYADHVSKGEAIAKASDEETDQAGTYYLAIKQDNSFVDPNKVIPIE